MAMNKQALQSKLRRLNRELDDKKSEKKTREDKIRELEDAMNEQKRNTNIMNGDFMALSADILSRLSEFPFEKFYNRYRTDFDEWSRTVLSNIGNIADKAALGGKTKEESEKTKKKECESAISSLVREIERTKRELQNIVEDEP